MLALRKGKSRKKFIQGNTQQGNSKAAKELECILATYAIYS